MGEDGKINDALRVQLQKILLETTHEFLAENREEIVNRAEKKMRERNEDDAQTALPKLD